MRISSDPRDPGYAEFQRSKDAGYKIIILLDGRSVEEVVTADELDGVIDRYVLDPILGKPIYCSESDSLLQETLNGRVRIVRRYPPVPGLGVRRA